MSGVSLGAALLGALFVGVPVAIALGVVGMAALVLVGGGQSWILLPSGAALNDLSHFGFLAIPLFVLMSAYITESGIGRRLVDASAAWLSGMPGHLHSAAVLGCALFAAMSGSSVATAIAIGGVILPEIQRRGHDLKLGIGAVAAGGTLGILIPPSNQFILYGVLTETSISKLFMAGVVPGLLMTAIFIAFNTVLFKLRPRLAPPPPDGGRPDWALRFATLRRTWTGVLLMLCVVGGIFLGVVTPTEAAGLGAAVALLLGMFVVRGITPSSAVAVAVRAVQTTAMVGFIIFGGLVLSRAATLLDLPQTILDLITGTGLSRWEVMILINVILLILGLFMDAAACVMLTVPLLFPTVIQLGFDPIWFGVVLCLNMELALITPPVGMNLFVLQSITGQPMRNVAAGTLPYTALLFIGLILVMVLPELSLWLPKALS